MYIYIPNKRLPPFFSKSNQVLTFSPSRLLSKGLLSRSPPNLWFTFRGGAPGTLHSLLLHSSVLVIHVIPFQWRHRGPLLWSCMFSLGERPGMVEYLLLGAGTYMTYMKHENVSDTLLREVRVFLRCPLYIVSWANPSNPICPISFSQILSRFGSFDPSSYGRLF